MEYNTVWRQLALCLVLCDVGSVEAAGTSIFKLGSEIDRKHWDVMGMYFIVFGITILFELVVHRLGVVVVSDSGKSIVHHITQEIMILGGISAVLVVFENMGGTAVIDAPLFHYVHFVIFVMAIFFIFLVSSLFFTVEYAWSRWSRFEHKIDEIESDPSLDFDSKAAFLQQYLKANPNGQRMLACVLFFRHNLPGPFADVPFSRYMKKMQRKYMLAFLDLHSSSWALLACLCAVAAVVTYITLQVSDNELATVGLWVLFVGFGPLLVLVITFFKIRNEYRKFTSEVLHMRFKNLSKPRRVQKTYFWQERPGRTIFLMQIMLLYQVFFLATAAVNFTYRLGAVKPLGPLLVVVCFIPSFFVFFLMVPVVLPPFTILASLGDLLDHDMLLRIKVQDRESGRYRRLERRDQEITAPPLVFSEKETVLQNFAIWQGEKDVTLQFHGPCEECTDVPASEMCNTCGYLCSDCSFQYHKLKQMAAHKRRPLAHTQARLDEEANQVAEDAELRDEEARALAAGMTPQQYQRQLHGQSQRQSPYGASPLNTQTPYYPPDFNPYDHESVRLMDTYNTLGTHHPGAENSPFSPSAHVNSRYNRTIAESLSPSQPRSSTISDRQLQPPPLHPRSSASGSGSGSYVDRPSTSGGLPSGADSSVLIAALEGLHREQEEEESSSTTRRRFRLKRRNDSRGSGSSALGSSFNTSSAPPLRGMGRGARPGPSSGSSANTPNIGGPGGSGNGSSGSGSAALNSSSDPISPLNATTGGYTKLEGADV